MEPTYENGDVKLWLGDCLEILSGLSGIDAVVTDPPYGTGAWKRPAAGMGSDCRAEHQQEDWDRWDDSWLERTEAATVGMFCPQTQLGEFGRMLIWHKPDARPRFSGQPAYAFEPFVIVRGVMQNRGGTDCITASAPRVNRDIEAVGHPHQKPLRVMVWCVESCSTPGQLVLDPFMGSGTTGVACVTSDRQFYGIEQDERYFDMAVKRIEAELNRFPLFDEPAIAESQQEMFA